MELDDYSILKGTYEYGMRLQRINYINSDQLESSANARGLVLARVTV